MNGKISRTAAAAIGVVAAFVVVAALFGFTVVSTDEDAALTTEFDPAAYVESVWDELQTSISDNAVDLAVILNQIEPDADGKAATEALTPVAQANGLITTGDAHVYRVNASGTVTDVDTSTSKGTIGLVIDGYDGPIVVRVYVGTRIPSDESSIRDATGFIGFGDFKDQTEFGKVASEINKKVVADLGGLDPEPLVGQHVNVTGAFTMRTFNQPEIDVSELTIVPLKIEVQ